MKKKTICSALIMAAVAAAGLCGLSRLLFPKYTGQVVEGAFIEEYYRNAGSSDVLFLGDCEVYENISPVTLWQEYGITSYIRGSAQQLIPQSYYLLKDTLRYEKPEAVVLSVSAMQQIEQINETYNRMTLDGMRWSVDKLQAVQATMLPDEHMMEYLFPILRFHSRWSELDSDDLTGYFTKNQVTHNGYYMRADIRPAGDFPTERRRSSYQFEEKGYEYLDLIRQTCEEEGIELILFKAPSLYPVWNDQWNDQMKAYASEHGLTYINALADIENTGIDFSHDTYDGGLHMNVYGAEKVSGWLGPLLMENAGLKDHRTDSELSRIWKDKTLIYDTMKKSQEDEFERLGYLKQFTGSEEQQD